MTMLQRYDATKDEMVELDQEYFNKLYKQFIAISLDYKKNCPDKYKEFLDNYTLTVKV